MDSHAEAATESSPAAPQPKAPSPTKGLADYEDSTAAALLLGINTHQGASKLPVPAPDAPSGGSTRKSSRARTATWKSPEANDGGGESGDDGVVAEGLSVRRPPRKRRVLETPTPTPALNRADDEDATDSDNYPKLRPRASLRSGGSGSTSGNASNKRSSKRPSVSHKKKRGSPDDDGVEGDSSGAAPHRQLKSQEMKSELTHLCERFQEKFGHLMVSRVGMRACVGGRLSACGGLVECGNPNPPQASNSPLLFSVRLGLLPA